MSSTPTRQRLPADVIAMQRCPSLKVGYATKAEADRAVDPAMLAGMVMPGCHLFSYPCRECGFWHLANRKITFPKEPA